MAKSERSNSDRLKANSWCRTTSAIPIPRSKIFSTTTTSRNEGPSGYQYLSVGVERSREAVTHGAERGRVIRETLECGKYLGGSDQSTDRKASLTSPRGRLSDEADENQRRECAFH